MKFQTKLIIFLTGLVVYELVLLNLFKGLFSLLGITNSLGAKTILSAIPVVVIILITDLHPFKFVHLLIMGAVSAVILNVIYALNFGDPTSNNLWPLFILFVFVATSFTYYALGFCTFFIKKWFTRNKNWNSSRLDFNFKLGHYSARIFLSCGAFH